jgi:hypothetical protein
MNTKQITKGKFMKNKRHWLILGSTALLTASLLSGCSGSGSKEHPSQATATPLPVLAAQGSDVCNPG